MTAVMSNHARAAALPRMTRNEAQARSALAQKARGCAFTWAGQPWELSVEPSTATGLSPLGGEECIVQAEWAGAPFALQLPATALQAWLGGRFPGQDWPALPDGFRGAMLEAACSELLELLNRLQRGPARIDGLQGAGDAAAALPQVF